MIILIVTDSTADLDADAIQRHQITVVPLNVHFGTEQFQDGITLTKEAFYDRMERSDILPRTSQPSSGTFRDTYASLKDAVGIVSIHIGGKLSGTVNAALSGANLLPEGAPPVIVVDSNQTSMGLGYAVISAAEAANAGANLEQTATAARECAGRARVLLFVDTLEYLQKGGRIGRARALLGTLLRTKPLLALSNGEIEPIERPRTRQKAMERLYELILKTPRVEEVAILFGTTPDAASDLTYRVQMALPHAAVRMVQVSPVIGIHTGPAALGAAILRAP